MIRRPAGVAFAIAVSFLFGALPADVAADQPNVNDILAHIRAAEGPPLQSYRETIDETVFGLQIRTVVAHAGKDFRASTTEGPLHTSAGVFGGQAWRQNENGETVLVAPDPGLAAGDTFATTVSPITSPVTGYLVSRLNGAGCGSKTYVDSSTWRVVREDRIHASGTSVTLFDDFRTVDGRTVAFHRSSTDGHAEDARDERVASISAGPVAPADVSIPPTTRNLVEFPVGTRAVSLPAHVSRGKYVVRVMIAGRGLDFEIDSGAAGIVLEQGVAAQLGLAEVSHIINGANAGRVRSTTVIVPEMSVGDLKLQNVVVRTVPELGDTDLLRDYRVVGLLGFDFIDAVALDLDYIDETVTAYDPQTFKPPVVGPHAFALDLRLGNQVPYTSVTINGAVGERFFLDTGAFGALTIFDPFVRRNPQAMVDEGGGGIERDVRLRGVGGNIPFKPYQLKNVQIGPVDFTDFLAFVVPAGSYDNGADGVIGPSLLHHFEVTLDYAHAKAYFAIKGDDTASPSPAPTKAH